MHFYAIILALCGILIASASATPTDFELASLLAIPNPRLPTYEADLAAAVSYARSHAAPVTNAAPTSDQDKTFTSMEAAAAAARKNKQCGVYSNIAGHFSFPTYTTKNYCNSTEDFEEMDSFWNWYCGFCIVFDGRSCQGDIRWSGGPKGPSPDDAHPVRGAKSYFCY